MPPPSWTRSWPMPTARGGRTKGGFSTLNKALLDTDIYSEILKAANPTVTRNATTYRRAQGILTFSTVTVMEVIKGFQKKQDSRRLQAFLNAVALEEIRPFDEPAAELAGRIS